MPNYHLHPQLDTHKADDRSHNNNNEITNNSPKTEQNTFTDKTTSSGFVKTHRRSTSHHNFTQVKTVNIHLNHPYTTFSDQPQEKEVGTFGLLAGGADGLVYYI